VARIEVAFQSADEYVVSDAALDILDLSLSATISSTASRTPGDSDLSTSVEKGDVRPTIPNNKDHE
jgi:hypothetical protein